MFGIVCSSYLFLHEEFALGRVYDPSWYSYLLNANLWNSSTVKHSQEITCHGQINLENNVYYICTLLVC